MVKVDGGVGHRLTTVPGGLSSDQGVNDHGSYDRLGRHDDEDCVYAHARTNLTRLDEG